MEIRYKWGVENVVADHLSHFERENEVEEHREIEEYFPYEQLMVVDTSLTRYANIVNFLVCKVLPPELSSPQRKKFLHDARFYQWDDSLFFQRCADKVV